MEPVSPPWVDDSRVEDLGAEPAGAVLLLAPRDTQGQAFLSSVGRLEAALAAYGVRIVRSGDAASRPLDDDEALRVARGGGADLVVDVRTWMWSAAEEEIGRRYFVEVVGDTLAEVDRNAYDRAPPGKVRYWYGSRVLDFRARLVRASDGAVVAIVEIRVPRVNVGDPLVVVFRPDGEIVSESYSWAYDDDRVATSTDRAVDAAFRRLAQILSEGR
jgi:hypothetical protein